MLLHELKYKLYDFEDEVIINNLEGHSRWVVELSNGSKIYQDDFRQYNEFNDERQYSTWSRLRDYCYSENIDIIGMYFQFRTNRANFAQNADGYYFCKSILAAFGMAENHHFFVTGVVINDEISFERWKIPEIILTESGTRSIDRDDVCLILNSRMREKLDVRYSISGKSS